MHKRNRVNKDLLEKYFRQECSLEEQKLVEEWLESDSDEETHVFSSEKEESRTDIEIWTSVVNTIKSRSIKTISSSFILKSAAAACISILLISLLVDRIDLNKAILAESSPRTLQFCEKLVLTPDTDQEITFISNCKSGNEISRTVTCKKGETYLALNFKFRGDTEIIVVNQNQFHELPHDLRIKVMRELNS